jgi:hypothetical protein
MMAQRSACKRILPLGQLVSVNSPARPKARVCSVSANQLPRPHTLRIVAKSFASVSQSWITEHPAL